MKHEQERMVQRAIDKFKAEELDRIRHQVVTNFRQEEMERIRYAIIVCVLCTCMGECVGECVCRPSISSRPRSIRHQVVTSAY